MNITTVTQNNFSSAIALLKNNNLPTEDISYNTGLFVLEEENKIVGTIALEHDTTDALLRSLAVAEEKKSDWLRKRAGCFYRRSCPETRGQKYIPPYNYSSEFLF